MDKAQSKPEGGSLSTILQNGRCDILLTYEKAVSHVLTPQAGLAASGTKCLSVLPSRRLQAADAAF